MNPFRGTIVANPWDAPSTDVPTIHQNVYESALQGLDQVRTSERSTSLLIQGQAGSGKTHLLGRLRKYLSLKFPTATDRDEALYVWVRLQTSPQMIWRTVRRTIVSDWFRPLEDGRCQFDRILFHRTAPFRPAEYDLEPWFEYMLNEHPDDLRDLIDQVATNLHLDRNTHIAFEHLAFGRNRRDLKAWLAGDSLPEAVLERMELKQDEGNDVEREEEAKQVVLMLCKLAGNGLPIVLSFDQVEALELNANDKSALFKFGQLVSTIHDNTTNVLIISSVQSAFADRLLQESRSADRDRMQSLGSLSLYPLQPDEAQSLVAKRLEAASPNIKDHLNSNPYWPIPELTATELFSSAKGVTPRQLLARCAEDYDNWKRSQTTTIKPTKVEHPVENEGFPPQQAELFLNETWETTIQEKLNINQPDHTEEILRHALPTTANLVFADVKSVEDEQLTDVSLILERTSQRTGLSVCVDSNMRSLSARLKRLKSQFEMNRFNRLVVVRDHRVPVSKTAKKAKEHLTSLEFQGAKIVYPSLEVLAALDALRALLSDAKSGDLSNQGETISPTTLEEWFTSHLAHDLQDFVTEVLEPSPEGTTNSDTKLIENLNRQLAEQPLGKIEEIAVDLESTTEQIIGLVRRHGDQFGLIGEPPKVIFQVADRS